MRPGGVTKMHANESVERLTSAVRLYMHLNRAKSFWIASGALLLCIVGVSVWPREPSYEGRSLSYWLDRLQPTVISPTHNVDGWPREKFRSHAAVIAWIARSAEMHQR